MGMSASQTRFLMLTAQKSNNEYRAQRISHERLMLAANTEKWTMEYNEKIQNTTLLFKANMPSDIDLYNYNTKLKYEDIVNSTEDATNPGLGARLTTLRGKVVVPAMPTAESLLDPNNKYYGLSENDFFVDPQVENPADLHRLITGGTYLIAFNTYNAEKDEDEWTAIEYSSISSITETYDKTDDAAAQAEYDRLQSEFQQKDKMMELELKQLESEHTALETEMESVQKVIQEDVEGSFKTFG